jgi:hypothetical protein
VYHGVVFVPANYPYGPPKIQLWTPSGRFKTHTNLCLSVSHHHPETWRPTLSIRSIVESVRVHLSTPADGAIGSIANSYEQRRAYATASRRYAYCRGGIGPHIRIDHRHMIRCGWVEGLQYQDEEDDEEDFFAGSQAATGLSGKAPSSSSYTTQSLLDDILLKKPMRMFLVGAFLVLFLWLQVR